MIFVRRLALLIFVLLVSLDQLLHVLVTAPFYMIGVTDLPNPDETVSSRVGRHAVKGEPWAYVAEWLINWLFFWQVDENGRRNHCRRSIEEARECPLNINSG